MRAETVKSLIIGHAIGDALGVPVEFQPRYRLEENPVTGMIGHGAHNVPAGTWSDDTSMTLCLLESLSRLGRVDYNDIMDNFIRWMDKGEFTATWVAFDVGITTRHALVKYSPDSKLIQSVPALKCGESGEKSNGNGSLMRIAPIALYLYQKRGNDLSWNELEIVHNVSRLTHAHPRSLVACGVFVSIALELLKENSSNAISLGITRAYELYSQVPEYKKELRHFRFWNLQEFLRIPEYYIKSTGYVVDTLEAALYCILNTDNYCECVLKAVNLGDDADTVGAVTGGLAGLIYGWKNIPPNWKRELLRIDYLEEVCYNFIEKFS